MPLPANFSGLPGEEPNRHFRNLCIELKKTIKSTKDTSLLQAELEGFVNASKQMNWHQKNTEVFHRPEGEKATDKVRKEFQRYIADMEANPDNANPQDLLDALAEVERFIKSMKVT